MNDAIRVLWTVAPLCTALIALVLAQPRLPAMVLMANLLSGQAFNAQLGAGAYSPWPAVAFGCIDYTTAVLFLAIGSSRCALLFAASTVAHGYFAFQLHELRDADLAYIAGLRYGWTTFTLSMLAGVALIGGHRGGKRRVRDGAGAAAGGGDHRRLPGVGAYARRG